MRTPTPVEGWGQRACMRVRGDPAIATVGSVQVLGKVLGLQVREEEALDPGLVDRAVAARKVLDL